MRISSLNLNSFMITLSVWFILGLSAAFAWEDYLPVFPGAKGFGTETPAGRGGKILKVTNLAGEGKGSLRAAIQAKGPRIIVFEVSGTIALTENLVIDHPFITITGQSAPSPGITLQGAGIQIKAHDVLIQHLRIRVGDAAEGPAPAKRDGCTIYGPEGYNVVLDHMSVSWAVDKNTSTWYEGVKNVTISDSIISEALDNSINPQGEHSMGSLVGDYARNVSFHGNLWAHNKARNPAMKGGTSTVVLNNVMYNAGYRYMYLADDFGHGPILASIVGNVFIPGPDTSDASRALAIEPNVKPGTRVYLSDNQYPGPVVINRTDFDPRASWPPVWHSSLSVLSSGKVLDRTLRRAGARPADRDAVDRRIVLEVKTGGGRIIDSQKQVGGWPDLEKKGRDFPVVPKPHNDDDGDGYTNIEEVLHRMAAQVEGRGN